MKRFVMAVVGVFLAWTAMDLVIHSLILGKAYEATAHLWRPMPEMKMGLMHVVTVLAALAFSAAYKRLVTKKSLSNGLLYGAILGFGTGVSMGLGSYSYMPITVQIAAGWFLGAWAEFTVGGLILGAVIQEEAPQ
ncbi:MAG: hypothetical protein HY548_06605 [Elusimicrobia bacterium]|nr:hypothetical protein [Elusimicrobiota bacterium]